MIKLEIDGEEYTEEEFQRDLKRYFDTLEETVHCHPCKLFEDCEKCMLYKDEVCGKSYVKAKPIKNSFEIIEKVYKWAKEHPVYTNRDKIKDVFGEEIAVTITTTVTYYANNESFKKWLNEEYKEPKKND